MQGKDENVKTLPFLIVLSCLIELNSKNPSNLY